MDTPKKVEVQPRELENHGVVFVFFLVLSDIVHSLYLPHKSREWNLKAAGNLFRHGRPKLAFCNLKVAPSEGDSII